MMMRELEVGGFAVKSFGDVNDLISYVDADEDSSVSAVVVSTLSSTESGWATCRSLRTAKNPIGPILVVVQTTRISDLEMRDDLYDDFVLDSMVEGEMSYRAAHLLAKSGKSRRPELIQHGPLILNTETYQALLDGKPLDLTYMEYELLKFLASRPGKVFTRDTLLSRVWGYEYFGGARTVDVHVRRLRAKLGEEHANLIDTVRSVGYRFGSSRWSSKLH
ncbi:MAG: response regulator transcription factor [Acidimicrobiales bacterium]|nr:response regulator transcription factor [Acidimicrobiales bacterium]